MMDEYLATYGTLYEATHWYGALFPVWFQVEKEAHMSDKKTSKDAERDLLAPVSFDEFEKPRMNDGRLRLKRR